MCENGAGIEFGEEVKDSITGFQGKVVARFVYMNGCVRYQVDKLDKDGKEIVEMVFDEQRLEPVNKRRVKATATAGGPRSTTPPRRR